VSDEPLFEYDESVIGVEKEVGAIEVTAERLQRLREIVGETNPRYTEQGFAPPSFLQRMRFGAGPDPRVRYGNLVTHAGSRLELLEPVKVGDTLTGYAQAKEVYAKTGRSGPMVFAVHRLTYRNQHGVDVAYSDQAIAHRVLSSEGRGGEAARSRPPEQPVRETPPERRAAPSVGDTGPIASERCFEDVDIGDEFEGEWTAESERVVEYIRLEVDGHTTDAARRFTDLEGAARLGLERPIAPGSLSGSVLARFVTDWMGEEGQLASIDVNYRRPVLHDERLHFVGLITDTEPGDDGGSVKLDVYFENERGERPLQGVAVVKLPSRQR
jgi:acyl dehydratase